MRRPLTLAVVAGAAALTVLAGFVNHVASSADRTVTVLASWGGAQRETFERVLAAFTEDTGIEVDYQGTTALREVLLSEVQAGAPPDIAILPSIGELAEYAQRGEVLALDDRPAWDESSMHAYGEPWLGSLSAGGREEAVYWFPVKVDLKSLVWYDAGRTDADGLAPLAGDGGAWCLGMGSDATSGWPGTDWVEDLLLQQAGVEVYEAWARGEDGSWTSQEMRTAWRTFGELVGGEGSGNAVASLTRDYGQASAGLGGGTCALDHQATHARGAYAGAEARFVPSARLFPGTDGTPRGWEVGGDFAAMFRDSDEAMELMRFLASSEAQILWAAEMAGEGLPPPLSAYRQAAEASQEDDPVMAEITDTLWNAPRDLCLDASDLMPPSLRDAFYDAVLTFLASVPEFLSSEARLAQLLGDLEELGARTPADFPWLPSACGLP
ncbi:ABC transporter substrate-binding protein [Streptomyces sp. SBT349]|uniref:ABC transporter substrate-binding protein n=1 Tax=Streptomyces sp. SBT349 TaxID=1580539 RepID=UPI00066E571C|nr:extracellular solute-binding protein [Streptomyces sp. SBT349]